jgi:FMN-dependent NADH-azoreductase
MAKILILHSSAQREGSVGRLLIKEFVERAGGNGHRHEFIERDLAHAPIPVLNDEMVAAIRTKPDALTPEQRALTAMSETLIEELHAADYVVIGAPMYNWGIPAALKAWIDQITRVGFTFRYTATGYEGTVNKPVLIIVTRGGLYDNTARAANDFVKPYLRAIFGVIGLVPTFVTAEATLMGDELGAPLLAAARASIAEIAATVR